VSHSVNFKPRPRAGLFFGTRMVAAIEAHHLFLRPRFRTLFAKVVNDAECPANCLGSSRSRSACSFTRSDTVDTLRGHVRDAELFKDHAGEGLL
jgi:hypothetical protein